MKHARDDYNKMIVDVTGKIPEDEPVFLIRGQDKSGPATLRFWAQEHIYNDGDRKMADIAEQWASKMEEWQKENVCKVADLKHKTKSRKG